MFIIIGRYLLCIAKGMFLFSNHDRFAVNLFLPHLKVLCLHGIFYNLAGNSDVPSMHYRNFRIKDEVLLSRSLWQCSKCKKITVIYLKRVHRLYTYLIFFEETVLLQFMLYLCVIFLSGFSVRMRKRTTEEKGYINIRNTRFRSRITCLLKFSLTMHLAVLRVHVCSRIIERLA